MNTNQIKIVKVDQSNALLGQKLPMLIDQKGNRWFPASDACRILEFKNHRDAVQNHLTSEMTTFTHRGKPGEVKRVLLIDEAGLCRLIMKSRNPAAVALADKTTDFILPMIRKHGGYIKDINRLSRGQLFGVIESLQKAAGMTEYEGGE